MTCPGRGRGRGVGESAGDGNEERKGKEREWVHLACEFFSALLVLTVIDWPIAALADPLLGVDVIDVRTLHTWTRRWADRSEGERGGRKESERRKEGEWEEEEAEENLRNVHEQSSGEGESTVWSLSLSIGGEHAALLTCEEQLTPEHGNKLSRYGNFLLQLRSFLPRVDSLQDQV
jgi:hypothetical protein